MQCQGISNVTSVCLDEEPLFILVVLLFNNRTRWQNQSQKCTHSQYCAHKCLKEIVNLCVFHFIICRVTATARYSAKNITITIFMQAQNFIAFYLLNQWKRWAKFNGNLVFSLSQAVVYEKPGFEGSCLEIDSDVLSFCESEGSIAADGANFDSEKLMSVGSLKIIGGLWVFILRLHCSFSVLAQDQGLEQSLFRTNFAFRWWFWGYVMQSRFINTALTSNIAALFSLQLGGLQPAWVWGPAAHPGGRTVPGLQRLGRLWAAPVTATNTGCEYRTNANSLYTFVLKIHQYVAKSNCGVVFQLWFGHRGFAMARVSFQKWRGFCLMSVWKSM